MDHNQVIKTLESLIPQGAKSGPESVIVKYASENNLSPAQLERVAQMYNVAMTINFMNKSASRGDTFQLIDTVKLMAKYTDTEGEKEASIPNEWEAWLAPDATTSKSASDTGYSNMDFPDIVALAKGQKEERYVETQKDYAYPALTSAGVWDTFRKESFDKFELDSVERIIHESEEEYRSCAAKIQDLIQIKGASFKEMVNDVYLSAPDSVFPVMEKLANYLKATHCPGNLDASAPTLTKNPALVRDRWGVVEIVEKAASAIETIKASRSYIDMYKEAASAGTQSPPDKKNKNKKSPGNGGGGRGRPNSGDNETEYETAFDVSDYDSEIADANKKDERPKVVQPRLSAFDEIKEISNAGLDATKKILNPNTYFENVGGFEAKLKAMLPNRVNKTQKAIDMSKGEAANVTTLQRLLITDPIISEADPNTVVSLYNTLQKANPDIASDPNVLRFALREAIQYDAVPMHTYKDFVETDQKHWQAEKDRDQVIGARYSI